MTAADPTTRERLLEAAEAVFAAQGFHAGVRAITERAGANVAAVHYHFDSKEGLIQAVIERRFGPVQMRRVHALEAAEQAHHGQPPLEAVVLALLEPTRELLHDREAAPHLVGLIGRIWFDGDDQVVGIVHQQFMQFQQRFLAAFARCRPDLSEVALRHRIHFIFGAMANGLISLAARREVCGLAIDQLVLDRAFDELVAFVTAGMKG